MSSFFFDRSGSRKIILMEAAGLILVLLATARAFLGRGGLAAEISLFAVLAAYGSIRFCSMWRWYEGSPKYSGIGVHFGKMATEASYVMAALGSLMLVTPSWVFPVLAATVLAVIAHINIILLCFHFRDRTAHPVNYYSGVDKYDAY